jgi:hypothetical protein
VQAAFTVGVYEPDYRPRHAVAALILLTLLIVIAGVVALAMLSAIDPLPYRDPEPNTTTL